MCSRGAGLACGGPWRLCAPHVNVNVNNQHVLQWCWGRGGRVAWVASMMYGCLPTHLPGDAAPMIWGCLPITLPRLAAVPVLGYFHRCVAAVRPRHGAVDFAPGKRLHVTSVFRGGLLRRPAQIPHAPLPSAAPGQDHNIPADLGGGGGGGVSDSIGDPSCKHRRRCGLQGFGPGAVAAAAFHRRRGSVSWDDAARRFRHA